MTNSNETSQTIALLGLGAMGARMGERLLDAGYSVHVYNRTAARADALVAKGAQRFDSPRQAVADADVVISIVRDDAASRWVWLDGEAGALGALKPGAVAIESSTLTLGWTAELAGVARDRGAAFIDAPVVGSTPQAEAGKLVHLVGGESATLDAVRGPLSALGASVHHVGDSGAGMAMKLAVNALFGIQVAALGELLGMLRRAGVGDGAAMEVLGALPVTSPAARGVGGLIAARKFDPMFPVELVAKDMAYVAESARSIGAEVPTAESVGAVYDRAVREGYGGDNIHGVARLFDR